MSVASHLKIDLADYDRRIRSFIPWYEEMLDAAADALAVAARTAAPEVVDLGIGTGALSARCLTRLPRARITGVDADPEILGAAAKRIRGKHVSFVQGSFERVELPRCDAFVSSLALHHIRTPRRKRGMYARVRGALKRGGVLVTADCMPSSEARGASAQHAAWRSHMRASYTPGEVARFFAAWAREDVYLPLDVELSLMKAAALRPDVVWRRGPFAVVLART